MSGEPSQLVRRFRQLPEREQLVVVAVRRGMRVEDLAEAFAWPTRTVRDVLGRANRLLAAPVRLCACGCGAELPAAATARRRFVNSSHRLRGWREGGGVKRNERSGSHTRSKAVGVGGDEVQVSAQEMVKSVAEIVGDAVAAGRATADDSVADVLVQEGYITAFAWPHAVDNHPGRVGERMSYIAAEPLTLASGHGRRSLGVGDLLHADEVTASRTALAGMLHRHEVIAAPSDSGIVGLASALLQRVDRLERLLASLHGGSQSA